MDRKSKNLWGDRKYIRLENLLEYTINGLLLALAISLGVIAVALINNDISEFMVGINWMGVIVSIAALLKFITHTGRQVRVDSANIMMKIESTSERNFMDLMDKIQNCRFDGINNQESKLFLDHLNKIAYLYYTDLIIIHDIRRSYGQVLKNLRCVQNIQNIIKADPDRYRQLQKLCDKV
ncbi:MAG: hypothetical protein MPL62_04235 [Alphaproteobacteria bacterium]|nr:hypothetical protein [Alphaproteobacteria bacterium]